VEGSATSEASDTSFRVTLSMAEMRSASNGCSEVVSVPALVCSRPDYERGRLSVRVGIVSGSGTAEIPGMLRTTRTTLATTHGPADITTGTLAGVDVVHISRHGEGHIRLSNNVNHRANVSALLESRVDCLVSLTVCGAVDPDLALGSLVVFDDLYYPSNRLPDGTLCTWYQEAGQSGRGHWIFDRPFSEEIRSRLIDAALCGGLSLESGGCYGHVDGPRFNTRAEIAAQAAAGVVAVSQTAGPEVVLAAEAELPMALVGYLTDYANGVKAEPEPVEALLQRIAASTEVFATLLKAVLPTLDRVGRVGTVHRFE
jgi:5'-methylthioadenosine phosphorylase